MKFDLQSVNWFGLASGVLMLLLPFMGFWWVGTAGTGAMEIGLSPFDFSASLLGVPLTSPLVGLFLLAAKISMLIAGSLMIAGSLFATSWWGKHLIRFGVMKPFWMIIMLIAMLVIGAFLFNNILPSVISGMAGGTQGGLLVNLDIPYIVGSTMSTIQIGTNATISAPITLSLTGTFWVATVVAALGIVSRIYQRKLSRPKN